MDVTTRPVVTYRWIVFLLALGYAIYHTATGDYSNFGGPFRFLTFWGLYLSVFSAWFMLAISTSRAEGGYQVLAMCTAVVNTMVLFLYWKLYFEDPNLVNANGPGAWWNEYYLHGAGPILQIIDALFIAQAFHRPWRAALPLVGIIAAFVLWGELVLQPLSDFPSGSVTSGLPYPFLNNMDLAGRATFYVQNAVIALILLSFFAALGWVIRRSRRLPEAL